MYQSMLLHSSRFCQDCIITALRSGNKECPTCRKKLVSKRSLRPDPNFDALISKIYPSRDEYEAHQERVLERLKQSMNQEAFNQNIEEGLRQQALSRNPRRRTNENDVSESRKGASDESNPAFDSEAGSTSQASPEVELVFKPHPSQATTEAPPTRYIKTTSSLCHFNHYHYSTLSLFIIISSMSCYQCSLENQDIELRTIKKQQPLQQQQ